MIEKKITAFINSTSYNNVNSLIDQLQNEKLVERLFLFNCENTKQSLSDPKIIFINNIFSSQVINEIIQRTQTDYALFIFEDNPIEIDGYSLSRLIKIAESNAAGITFSNYYLQESGNLKMVPLVDCQFGSVRDDFDFGSMVLISNDLLKKYLNHLDYLQYSGFYSLILFALRHAVIKRIPEALYLRTKISQNDFIEKQFGYLNPTNQLIQTEREKVLTDHLKKIGAYIFNSSKKIIQDETEFLTEASIIIPVKNREATIGDALTSALAQETDFNFNVIVVDNYSTDKTPLIVESFAKKDRRLMHIIPKSRTLGIGGCWNLAVNDDHCGKYSVQLDSDDVYSDNKTLQKIIDKLRIEKTAMLIGAYKIVDFKFNEIPPGIISHSEWTDDNGCNNALRINGLGAPRAYYTPLIKQIQFPNVSYGEDYSAVLEITRDYRISRIYEPIYLCRRWSDNTDSKLNRMQENDNNWYKDFIRTQEIIVRQKINNR